MAIVRQMEGDVRAGKEESPDAQVSGLSKLAPQGGFEPPAKRLTAACSTTELLGIMVDVRGASAPRMGAFILKIFRLPSPNFIFLKCSVKKRAALRFHWIARDCDAVKPGGIQCQTCRWHTGAGRCPVQTGTTCLPPQRFIS